MSALENYYANQFLKSIGVFVTLVLVAIAAYFIIFPSQRKCSDDQLHIVIDKVHECKKKNVICQHSEIERLIKEVCGK